MNDDSAITSAPAAFDVSLYELADEFTLRLKNARGDDDLLGSDGKPVSVDLFSPGSPPGVKAQHKAGRAAQARQWRMLRDQIDPQEAEKADREAAEKLAGFTKGFSANFPITPINVYSNPRLCYINEQVGQAISKFGNFSKGSSTN